MFGYALIRYLGVSFHTAMTGLAAIVIAMVAGYPIGLLVGHFISRDSDVDTFGFRAIAWANILGWVLPPIGLALSAMTWLFYRRSEEDRTLYWWLSLIGGLLALASVIVGVARDSRRTSDRCAFAAQEHWSKAEFETNCVRRGPGA